MTEDALFILEEIKEGMQHAISHLEKEFHKFRTGKANPQMLEGVKVDYYGNPTSVDKIANINTPDDLAGFREICLDVRICGRVPAWVTSQVYDKA